MIFRQRPIIPGFFLQITRFRGRFGVVNNSTAWGLQYAAKLRDINKSDTFQWATFQGKRVNQLIESDLEGMTQNHCAFCDGFPVRQLGSTIEHFRPKTRFPELSHTWDNLFYCCNACQNCKQENFNENLLKPDVLGYDFTRFFIFTFEGEAILLNPNPRASDQDRLSSEVTIRLYGLNDFQRPELRYMYWSKFNVLQNQDIDNFPYRYLFL